MGRNGHRSRDASVRDGQKYEKKNKNEMKNEVKKRQIYGGLKYCNKTNV